MLKYYVNMVIWYVFIGIEYYVRGFDEFLLY